MKEKTVPSLLLVVCLLEIGLGQTVSLKHEAIFGHAFQTGGIPTISSFFPTFGPIGTSVTIIGTNFDTSSTKNIVFFGNVRAVVTSASTTSLGVTVPVGASHSPLKVTVAGLSAFATNPFVITFHGGDSLTTDSFVPKVDFATGNYPNGVAMGDLDGDGKVDLVTDNFSSNSISVLRNTSLSGTISANSFASKVDFITGRGPYRVLLEDLNGDGKLDLVVVNSSSDSVSVFRNTTTTGTITSGSFAAKVDFATGSNPVNVAIGDVNGDGKPDLAVTNFNSHTVSVFRNTITNDSITTGSFAPKIDFATGTSPSGVAIGDLDGDGRPDLAVTNSNSPTVSVLRNTSVNDSITNSSFAPKVDFATGNFPAFMALGDLDGDGKIELAVTNYNSNTVSIFLNTSVSGSITSGSFAPKVDFPTGLYPSSVGIGDLDGDGRPDLAVVNNQGNSVSVFRNKGTVGAISSGSFSAKVDFGTGVFPGSISIGDLDQDGRPELAVTNSNSNSVSVFLNIVAAFAPPKNLTALSGFGQIGLKWNKVSGNGLLRYRIFQGTSPGATQLADSTSSGNINDTSKTILGLTNDIAYYFRVAAVDSTMSPSGFSNEVICVPGDQIAPAAPTNLVVFDTASTKIGIRWRKNAEPDFLRYRIYRGVATNPTTKVDSTTGGISDTSKILTGLTNATKYYLRVTAIDFNGNESSYSNEVTGTPNVFVAVDNPHNQIPVEYSMSQNYPNPFNPSTIIRYGIPVKSRVKLEVYDVLGRLIQILVDEEQEAKFYQQTWNTHVPTGLYLCRIEAIASDDSNIRFFLARKMLILK